MKAAASLSSSMQSISLAPAASGCVSNLLDLPPEMLGEILLRLADARSLAAGESGKGQAAGLSRGQGGEGEGARAAASSTPFCLFFF